MSTTKEKTRLRHGGHNRVYGEGGNGVTLLPYAGRPGGEGCGEVASEKTEHGGAVENVKRARQAQAGLGGRGGYLGSLRGLIAKLQSVAMGLQWHGQGQGGAVALANGAGEAATGLANAGGFALTEPEILLVPYGEWDHRLGLQVLDKAAAQAMATALENRAAASGEHWGGLPVYRGHPELTSGAARDDKAYGWIVRAEARSDGLALRVKWTEEGLGLVNGGAYKWFSPYWLGRPLGGRKFAPIELKSVGLTNEPNIPVRALANSEEQPAPPEASAPEEKAAGPEWTALLEALGCTVEEAARLRGDGTWPNAAVSALLLEKVQGLQGTAQGEPNPTAAANGSKSAKMADLGELSLPTAPLALDVSRALGHGAGTNGPAAHQEVLAAVNARMRTDRVDFGEAWRRCARAQPTLFANLGR